MTAFRILIVLCCMLSAVRGSDTAQSAQNVDFCEIIRNPSSFSGQTVVTVGDVKWMSHWLELVPSGSCKGHPIQFHYTDELKKASSVSKNFFKTLTTYSGEPSCAACPKYELTQVQVVGTLFDANQFAALDGYAIEGSGPRYSLSALKILSFKAKLPVPGHEFEHFKSGPYEGFAISPIEHIIVERATEFLTKGVRGTVLNPQGDPLPAVLVELRDSRGVVRAVYTNAKGEFEIPHASAGTYRFKLTSVGFQSVVGTVVVSPHAPESTMKLEMPLGV